MSFNDRLALARAWHASRGNGAPSIDDVEMVARLGVDRLEVVKRMLWSDGGALVASFEDLAAAIGAQTATPTNGLGPAPATPNPPASSEPLPPEATPTEVMSPAALARYAVLTSFVAERQLLGDDVTGVTDANLREAAQSDRPAFKRYGPFLRQHGQELLDRLNQIEVPPDEEPPPAVPSEQEPAAVVSDHRTVHSGPAEPTDFQPWNFADSPTGSEPTPLDFSLAEEGLAISWAAPPDDGAVRIFRVVANDEYLPDMSPELGELLAATFDDQLVDPRIPSAPVRHIAVWVNTGPTERGARESAPVVYATGSCVLPVRNCVIREDEGTVLGQWLAVDGVDKVEVLRLPLEVARQQKFYNPNYCLPPETTGLGGFTDTSARPGDAYEYRVYAFANVNEVSTQSPYIAQEVRVAAVVQKIDDLKVEACEDSDERYDLSWTQPQLGTVEIYRSAAPPASGIDAALVDRSALVRQGLTPDLRVTRQLAAADGRQWMREVPWPQGWSRAYFTAVTVLDDDRIQVGNVVILNRTGSVSQVHLHERVDEQFITFAWPAGAAQVRVFVGPQGAPLVNPEAQTPVLEVFEDDYRRYGGAHLVRPLPEDGCAVHVVAVSFANATTTLSTPFTLEYPGLSRIRYEIQQVPRAAGVRGKANGPVRHRVVATAGGQMDNVSLVIVHQPDRLPLHAKDGLELGRRVVSLAAGAPVVVFDGLDLTSRSGYVRLLAEVPDDLEHLMAVLDPPIGQLRIPTA